MASEPAREPEIDLETELEQLHPSAWGWALVCCQWQRDRAEEVLQASYLKAFDGRARFAGRSTTRTWFFGVIRNTAAESIRRSIARRLNLSRWVERANLRPVPAPDRMAEDAEMRRVLRDGLSRLSERQRQLLHLVFYQDLTIEEAASVLDLSVGTARTHYQRGKARLRAWLEATGEQR